MNTIKVGIVCSKSDAKVGGGFTFEESVKEALLSLSPDNITFVFYVKGELGGKAIPLQGRMRNVLSYFYSRLVSGFGLVSQRHLSELKGEVGVRILGSGDDWNTDNALNNELLRDECDFVYFMTPNITPVEMPFIVTHWDLGHRQWPVFPEVSLSGWTWGQRELFYSNMVKRAALVITGTQTGKEELIAAYGIREQNIIVNPFPVPGWINKVSAKKPSNFQHTDFLFYPAQFWPHKNHIVLLEMMRILKKDGINVSLVFSGSDKGNLEYIMSKIKEYNLEDCVSYLGFIDREVLLWLYQNTRLMVFPCIIGPDNLPPLEALYAGSCVAVADIPGARDYLPGNCVEFFDPTDEKELAVMVKKLLVENEGFDGGIANGLTDTAEYAHVLVSSFRDLNAYRRCWGRNYSHL